MNRFFRSLIVTSVLGAGVVGCAGDNRILGDTFKLAFTAGDKTDITLAQDLNPRFRYLRVTLKDRPFLLVLGYIDKDAIDGEPVDVWYTGQGEVLKIKNGRIVGSTGMQADWYGVRFSGLPTWSVAADLTHGSTILGNRIRDVKTGYQWGVEERVTLTLTSEPKKSALAGAAKTGLIWLGESYQSSIGLPPSQFAIQKTAAVHQVVYSLQCLSPQLCLNLQEWTAADQAAALALKAGKP